MEYTITDFGVVVPKINTDRNNKLTRAMTYLIDEVADGDELAKSIFEELGSLVDPCKHNPYPLLDSPYGPHKCSICGNIVSPNKK